MNILETGQEPGKELLEHALIEQHRETKASPDHSNWCSTCTVERI
jgi:hypothetical protein